MLGVLVLLAVLSVWGSALPPPLAVPSSLLVAGYGAWSIRRYWCLPAKWLLITGGELPASLDGAVLMRLKVQWRGPLAFVAWQDFTGRSGHLAWWPDTLDARQRRELRLAVGEVAVSPAVAVMAP